jgi:hypothetical protein
MKINQEKMDHKVHIKIYTKWILKSFNSQKVISYSMPLIYGLFPKKRG